MTESKMPELPPYPSAYVTSENLLAWGAQCYAAGIERAAGILDKIAADASERGASREASCFEAIAGDIRAAAIRKEE